MVFAALSLVAMIFFGAAFDDFSRSLLSLIFAVVFLLVFEHYFGKGWNHFFVLSISSMVPYPIWLTMDHWAPMAERHDMATLLTILPFAVVLTLGLDFLFRHMRNKQGDTRPLVRRRAALKGNVLRRLT